VTSSINGTVQVIYFSVFIKDLQSFMSLIKGPPEFQVTNRRNICAGCWWGSLRERDHWGDQDVDGRIILRWIFRKLEEVVGTGWSWLRIGTGGGHLCAR
jgi:hypothetical protein